MSNPRLKIRSTKIIATHRIIPPATYMNNSCLELTMLNTQKEWSYTNLRPAYALIVFIILSDARALRFTMKTIAFYLRLY